MPLATWYSFDTILDPPMYNEMISVTLPGPSFRQV